MSTTDNITQAAHGTCPHCGYCPHCGRANAAPYYPAPYPWPYTPWYPRPYYPWGTYTVTCGTDATTTGTTTNAITSAVTLTVQ